MDHLETPRLKKSQICNILFLRDDDSAVSLRLGPLWIKFLTLLLALFAIVTCVSGYTAQHYWKKCRALQRERAILTQSLSERQKELGRLAGIEYLKESTLPRSTMSGVGDLAAQAPETAQATAQPAGKPDSAKPGAATPVQTEAAKPEPAKPEAAKNVTASTPSAPESVEIPQAGPQAAAVPAVQAEPAKHPALISEVQVQMSGEKSYKLSFDISNRDPQVILNGRVQVFVLNQAGERQEVTLTNKDSLRFVISRYKRVNTTFSLPAGINAGAARQLFLTVVAEGFPTVTYNAAMPTT